MKRQGGEWADIFIRVLKVARNKTLIISIQISNSSQNN